MSEPLASELLPATTTLPSGCTAIANASSKRPPKSVRTLPPVPNVGSSAPLASYRVSAKSEMIELLVCANPAATMRPSAWTATARAPE